MGRRWVEVKQTTFTVSLEAASQSGTDVSKEGKKKKKGDNLVILMRWRKCLGLNTNLDLKLDLNLTKLSLLSSVAVRNQDIFNYLDFKLCTDIPFLGLTL